MFVFHMSVTEAIELSILGILAFGAIIWWVRDKVKGKL